MVSPVPKYLRTPAEHRLVPAKFRQHCNELTVDPADGVRVEGARSHPAKFAPGLATVLLRLAASRSVGDPMAGTGMLAHETDAIVALNDIDCGMAKLWRPLKKRGCEMSFLPADRLAWHREVCVFSPPYYPRTDRQRPNAKPDYVGFSDTYRGQGGGFIGNPGGVEAIRVYREQMTRVYAHLAGHCGRMIVVTKNWMRLGVELRLDLDTILMAQEASWRIVGRHGFEPPPSLWSRFNARRGGMVQVEDILVFERKKGQ
jgi:hypothetical protein